MVIRMISPFSKCINYSLIEYVDLSGTEGRVGTMGPEPGDCLPPEMNEN